jgi:hypothetical protein
VPSSGKWIEQVAGSTGLSVGLLQELLDLTDAGSLDGSTASAIGSLLSWLNRTPEFLLDLVRPESLEGLFGDQYKRLPSDTDRAQHALAKLASLWPSWMSGLPLSHLEVEFLRRTDRLGFCEHARHFVSRIVPDLAFLAEACARGLEVFNNLTSGGVIQCKGLRPA